MQFHNVASNRTLDSFCLTLLSWFARGKSLHARSCAGRAGLLAVFLAIPCFAQDDAATLQLRSIQVIDRVVEHFRKTGDRQSLLPQLQQAEKDLLVSSQTFLNNGDLANATVSLLKLGTAQRMRERWVAAKSSYQAAYETAVRARDAGNQAKALRGMAMVEFNGLQNYDVAISNLEESIRLSSSGADKKVLFEALELKATIQETRGDLTGAADTINRAHLIASGLKDDMSLFFALFERASIYRGLAKKCDEKSKDDRRTIVHLRGWERVYGDSKVYVKSETKSGLAGPIEWTDVYLKQSVSEPINVSRCDGTNCSQPALSQNKRFVAYIKIKTSDP